MEKLDEVDWSNFNSESIDWGNVVTRELYMKTYFRMSTKIFSEMFEVVKSLDEDIKSLQSQLDNIRNELDNVHCDISNLKDFASYTQNELDSLKINEVD